jgi:hypothetical protein
MLLKPKLIIANIRYSFPGAEIVYLNNPYGFYEIMRSIFPDAAPWMYEEDIVVKIKNRFFNISGEVKGNFTPMTQERINFLKKTRNDRIYNRSVTPVPAESGRKNRNKLIHLMLWQWGTITVENTARLTKTSEKDLLNFLDENLVREKKR